MRIAALLLAGSMLAASAQAQNPTRRVVEFLPIPDMAPPFLFAPHPLSGTMLKPFTEPAGNTPTEIAPDPGRLPVAVARTLPDDTPAVEPAAPPEDAAPAEPAPTEPAPADAVTTPEPAAPPPAEAEPPPPPASGTVTVIVENVETDTGTVKIAICDKDLSREGCPYKKEVPAALGFVQTEFDDIPPGRYAVVSYHDVNGNNEFDKLFGVPREPYALSNNASAKLVPTFRDAALAINAGPNNVVIRLKRLGG